MTTIEKQPRKSTVGPSADDWVTLGINVKMQGIVTGLTRDGGCYHDIIDSDFRLDLLEYAKNKSRNLNSGGDAGMVVDEVIQKFYVDRNIELIYGQTSGTEINLMLVLSEEVDQMALKLARLQNAISREHPQYLIEIMYTPKELFSVDFLPEGAVEYRR